MSERTGGASVTVDAVAERIANARISKALALAKKLRAAGITATEAMDITDDYWVKLAEVVGVNAPSQTTARLVVQLLAGMGAKE